MSSKASSTNHAFSVFGFLGSISMIILLPMHFRAKNISLCLYIVWTSICCLVYSVNSVVWDDNVENWAPVWCDISSRLLTASTAGNQMGLLFISRRLYRIINMTAVNQSSHQIRRDIIIELSLGIGLPLLLLLFQYIVEFERFIIVENMGCFPATLITPPAFPLVIIWSAVFALVTALYAGFAIHATLKRKAYKREVMQSDQHLKVSHYWRLLAFSGIGIICSVSVGLTTTIYIAILQPSEITPYSWNSVHSNLSQILQYPVSEWASSSITDFWLESNRWFPVFYALTFFAFLGFTKDARQSYRLSCLWVIRCMGFRPPVQESSDARFVKYHIIICLFEVLTHLYLQKTVSSGTSRTTQTCFASTRCV
ncbi:hypothetical protein SERLA73DRAFT_49512 [Serpula lacrymans var. lacrymans S7.3]|uniref:Fungal pheromone STE3G-protein-coupled receptor n=1 Tax=Serpula lacrymans var. lacrymans (strain S7.3) TaxID=936435 RepID=F8PQ29_SERL3|nr:hypothetical protein SERLA73DRAFT_49512 [Serpula lacrymans var. lacrymans S7.3]